MKINVLNWLHKLSSVVLIIGFIGSIAISGLPVFNEIEFYLVFWAIVMPIWVISLVVFLLLRAFEEHIILQNKILERLDYTFKVEEQKRVEDPLSRF